jgi:hypothetical protein
VKGKARGWRPPAWCLLHLDKNPDTRQTNTGSTMMVTSAHHPSGHGMLQFPQMQCNYLASCMPLAMYTLSPLDLACHVCWDGAANNYSLPSLAFDRGGPSWRQHY